MIREKLHEVKFVAEQGTTSVEVDVWIAVCDVLSDNSASYETLLRLADFIVSESANKQASLWLQGLELRDLVQASRLRFDTTTISA